MVGAVHIAWRRPQVLKSKKRNENNMVCVFAARFAVDGRVSRERPTTGWRGVDWIHGLAHSLLLDSLSKLQFFMFFASHKLDGSMTSMHRR